jgi:hypothetical protein
VLNCRWLWTDHPDRPRPLDPGDEAFTTLADEYNTALVDYDRLPRSSRRKHLGAEKVANPKAPSTCLPRNRQRPGKTLDPVARA